MTPNLYHQFLHNFPHGFCLFRIAESDPGGPADAWVEDTNSSFGELVGTSPEAIVGRSLRGLFPALAEDPFDWFSWLTQVVRSKKSSETQQYITFLNKWIKVSASYAGQDHVAVVITDITHRKQFLKQLVSISEDFLQTKGSTVDYQKITNLMLQISGADYVVMNVYDENAEFFTTRAVAGSHSAFLKACQALGFEVIGKKWDYDPVREEKIKNQSITVFSHLDDLAGNVVPAAISNSLEKLFNIKEVLVAKITPGDQMIGDFTFFLKEGNDFCNHHEVEIFARQVGTFILGSRSEQALLKKEKKYREIFESIQDVYFETNAEGTILEISPSVEKFSRGQYTREYLLGKNLREFYADFGKREQLIAYLMQHHEVYDHDVQLLNRDGTSSYGTISARIIYDEKGRFEKITGVMHDISQRLEQEAALKAGEERFRKLAEATSAAVMIHKGGKFLFVNPAAETLSGYSRQELLQKDFWDLVHEEDQPLVRDWVESRKKGIPTPKRNEIRMFTKNGEERWLDLTAEETELEGEWAMVATAFDITLRKKALTSLKQSEERFRRLIDNAFDGIYLIHEDRYQYVNDRFCQITGYTRKALLSEGFSYKKLLTPESEKVFDKRYNDRKQGKKVPRTYELVIRQSGGSLRNVEISTVRIMEEAKPFYIGIVRDITERKNNEKLQEKVALAQKAAQFKQNFLANMSHEMRTPMNGIIGMAKIMGKSELTMNQRNYLKVIEESSKTLLSLINEVLHLSKIEAGKVQLEKETVRVDTLVSKISGMFGETAREKNLSFSCQILPDFPEAFMGDEQRILQILNNLTSNAIKFTTEGQVRLLFRQLENYHDHLTLKVSVEDTGEGIATENQELIFDEFSQVDTSSTRRQEGTGLGLAISRKLAEMMGGTIQVESTVDKGSTFHFTFKAQKAFDGLEQGPQKVPVPAPAQNLNCSVLVVEDKLVNRLVAELMLKDLGCHVHVAENGLIAVEKVINNHYDAVLMDIQMPVMDGITAVKELRKLKIRLPAIIGLSAEAMEGDAERYIAQGMDDYLTKPLDQELLARKLKEHTSRIHS